jgi:hypothetical protein
LIIKGREELKTKQRLEGQLGQQKHHKAIPPLRLERPRQYDWSQVIKVPSGSFELSFWPGLDLGPQCPWPTGPNFSKNLVKAV